VPLSSPTPSSTTPSLKETLEATIGPELAGALEQKGFERLTPVQEAVLAPDLQGRDLRISSQTGSGKTVAIGLTIRDHVRREDPDTEEPDGGDGEPSGNVKGRDQRARPRALVVTPTRELAKQVEEELAWLYAPLGARVTSVTGGGGYRDELRAFRAKPAIIVGTPGRLLDHLKRGAIDPSATSAVVLDEADRMLDLGFREDLEAILGFPPAEHETHLVSATFPHEVRTLADRVQKDPVQVEGTPLGTANLDIEHVIHLVHPRERLAAMINLLLEKPGGQTLIFARTRADVAEIAELLGDAGFAIAMLSGEMEQAERNRALSAFKRGNMDALVATDVAARGIDVQDVTRVIHAEPPSDADTYTHRSGRTGRAGKKGTSSILVAERELARTVALLGRARMRWNFAPVPTAESLRDARDEDLFAKLTADFVEGEPIEPRSLTIAERLLSSSEPARAVGRLVALALRRAHAEPREVTLINPPSQGARGARRQEFGRYEGSRDDGGRGPRRSDRAPDGSFVPFRVSWGQSHGADPRRLVAMMCRRGKIEGRDIGAIRVGRTSSVIEVSASVAADFEHATAKPDPRDPRVHIRRWSEQPTGRDEPRAPAPRHVANNERQTPEDLAEVPSDRPSRTIAKERLSVPKDRESTARIPKDRPSVPKDKPSVPKDRESTARVPKDRPSVPKDKPSVPKDKPSVPKDKPSVPKDRESTARVPKERPSRAAKEPPHGHAREEKPGKPWQGVVTSKRPGGAPEWRRPDGDRATSGASAKKSGPPWQKRDAGRPGEEAPWRHKGGKRPAAGGHAPPKRRGPAR
jgi:ATP-dependent RNA helicase DeaD